MRTRLKLLFAALLRRRYWTAYPKTPEFALIVETTGNVGGDSTCGSQYLAFSADGEGLDQDSRNKWKRSVTQDEAGFSGSDFPAD